MPTLTRLSTCTIKMYAADHLPPHFHVRMNDGREALVQISNLMVLSGSITQRQLAPALAWAIQNLALLSSEWRRLNP